MINVTGSLQIKNNIYQAVLSYKENGKWTTKSKTTKIRAEKGNKKKAEKELKRIIEEFTEKLNSETVEIEKIDFLEYLKRWLEITKSSIEETTYIGYKKLINGRITDYFTQNKTELQELKPIMIQKFYQYLLENNLSGNTVKHYHAIIRKALNYAYRTELIDSNPADKVELPKIEPYIAKHYSQEEVLQLLDIVKDSKLETPIIFGAFYGLRRSEIIGLKWSAIDFENKTIIINHVVTQLNDNGKTKLIVKNKTKTKSSTRTLPLQPFVEQYLIELKKKQEDNKSFFGDNYNQDYLEYICVDDSGKILLPDFVSHKFSKILKQNNLRQIRLHDLRHTVASLLLEKGIHMKEIQAWLGHSNYNTTANTYAHLACDSLNKSSETISEILDKKNKVAV